MAEIVLDKVSKSYRKGDPVIREIDLTIADEEFLILVGPSGCGKSTILNMIAGLEDITSGELRIGGERMNDTAPQNRNIAMVFQSYALYPHMTVRENIAFPLTIARTPKNEIREKVGHAAEILELDGFLDRRPGELSGGQRQRVAMGRAIVREPQAFLMDEPLSNLDAKLRAQMRTSISRLQKSLATTTVYVTHDQTEAMTLGDRIVVLRDGVAQQIGSPEDLYERPANLFVAGFIGSPTMNFLPGRVVEGRVQTAIGALRLGDEVQRDMAAHDTEREVIVGLRPEAFEDAEFTGDEGRLGFDDTVDIVESLGASKLAYFNLDEPPVSEHLKSVADVTGGRDRFGTAQLVAQIDARSRAREGSRLRVTFDPHDALVFDPEDGSRLGHLV
ncbi:carbohydrate ABC transporter ATP-binding protein (CUT1 family) [Stackebrandtia albiflava]|uniref:Carbohydrate ABC transporter ATP-binding protein (CUT1 family) n=1 Tax=Stackebrandtia albiflava TaxID=406432 RepID=A0A562UZ15_9ACTN|nr:sn-glycerol-3-phosphate ABC transporter ATP-binding protein UgpC [Stackebrandtia albiflava]TWJ10827.1 carbohydrate ABC transporter ATP-binding protein (CUT1 family) [Stackebrandtia albiflava]